MDGFWMCEVVLLEFEGIALTERKEEIDNDSTSFGIEITSEKADRHKS